MLSCSNRQKWLAFNPMNPKNADLYYNLGLVFHQQGDLEAAAAEYKKAIEIDPQHSAAYYCLGNI